MKHYLLFFFPEYYPSGGWNDFVASFDSPVEALAHTLGEGKKLKETYWGGDWQLIDGKTGEEIDLSKVAQ